MKNRFVVQKLDIETKYVLILSEYEQYVEVKELSDSYLFIWLYIIHF